MLKGHKIYIDGQWNLSDLQNFSRGYLQIYSFYYCLDDLIHQDKSKHLIDTLEQLALNGGVTYVVAYDKLIAMINPSDRRV